MRLPRLDTVNTLRGKWFGGIIGPLVNGGRRLPAAGRYRTPLPPMALSGHRLLTLGRLALVAPDGSMDESLQKRRRKLAVLAVLAVERRPLARDVLVEMFWGDQNEERARHSLSDALSHLRRVIGRDAISLSSTEVSLAPGALGVDAVDVLGAAQAKQNGRVIETYPGPFLEGVYIADAPSFEQWVARQRRRFEDLFLQACAAECAALARARQWEECGRIAGRWLDVAPLSADAALFRLNALKAAGTSEADHRALAEYGRIETRLRRDYSAAPDRAVAELAASIAERVARAAPAAAAPAPATPPAPPPAPSSPTASPRPPQTAGASRPWMRRPLVWGVAAASMLALALAGTAIARGPALPTSPNVVAVLPFEVRGGNDLMYLRDGMADLLSTNLDGAGSLRSVDPRAVLGLARRAGSEHIDAGEARRLVRQIGAGLLVLGDVVAVGQQVRISAALYDQRGGEPLARGMVDGPVSDLFAMVDQLTRQLLAGYPDRAADQLSGLAARTTTSLPALKAYLDGVTLYRRASYHEAQDAFERAAAQDSTFALAHYQLSNALLWAAEGTWDSILHSGSRAVRYSDRLNRRARLLVDAYHAFRAGDFDRAEQLYRETVARFPDDVEAWYQLGDVLFHGNPPRGRSMAESREAFEQVLRLEPGHRAAMIHLLRVALHEGRRDEARSLLERALPMTQVIDQPELVTLRAAMDGSADDRRDALAALRRTGDEVVRVTAMRVALFTGDLGYARRISRLLVEPTRASDFRVAGRFQLADLALAGGRRRDARAQIDSAIAEGGATAGAIAREYGALHVLLPFLPADSAAIRAARDSVARMAAPPPTGFPMFAIYNELHAPIRHYLVGLLSSRIGDEAAASRAAAELDAAGWPGEKGAFAAELAASVRAHEAARHGDAAAAVATLDGGRRALSEGLLDGWFGDQALERFQRAEWLRARGRLDEAYGWYASLGQTAMHQVVYLAPAALAMAAIDERRGRTAVALAHYRRAIALWNDCDPELRPVVDRARLRVAALTR